MYKVVIELKSGDQWSSEPLELEYALSRLASLCYDHAGWFEWIQIEEAGNDYSGRPCEYDGFC